ncbi:ubiquinone biosynthesis protein UbiA [Oleiphilus sp. HI0079]|uniref:prenyltransferase n=2 Tax=Oleiphilus sp. HI0079 TaxID=1822254 RepID=UPI0007C359F6|nr:prenyltransferase [Oleiphilus sp. HI0079]KZZ16809.1 ubiquinone biosynthesis protein UbiA [Oleiphilus sp. HI0079]
MNRTAVLQATRPPFLILTPACVFLGASIAFAEQAVFSNVDFALVLIGAMAAHISVNTLNEYFDFKSGLDLNTNKTPFSGGSGALPDYPEAAGFVLITGLMTLTLTSVIGGYFLTSHGPEILPIGLAGMVLVATYTQWLNRLPLLCLIAPGLGFGVLMVVGTNTVLNGSNQTLTWLLSLVPFCLVNNILLLNQYPDLQADQASGRKTFPIVFGLKSSNVVYALFTLVAYSLIALCVAIGYLPTLGLMALLPLCLSLFALHGAVRHTAKIGEHPKYLAANVAAGILTPILIGGSLLAR